MISISPSPENFVPSFFLPYTQTNIYGELQMREGRAVESFLIKDDERVIGYMQIVVYPLLRNMSHVYIPYGPVLTEERPEVHMAIKDFLRGYGKEHNAVFTRLDFFPETTHENMYKRLPGLAYHAPYFQPRGEMLLDITMPEENLLNSMHKKTRYNIRKSERNGLETSIITGRGIAIWVDTFIAINETNTKAHGTTTHPKSYFKSLFSLLAESNNHFLAVTQKDNHVVAINVFMVFGNYAYCPFGASNDVGKKLGAYYHIKWHSILYMKTRGIQTFNWGGISVSEHDRYLQGVTDFKKGFGGEALVHGPILEIIHKPFWRLVYLLRKWVQSITA